MYMNAIGTDDHDKFSNIFCYVCCLCMWELLNTYETNVQQLRSEIIEIEKQMKHYKAQMLVCLCRVVVV